MKSDRTSGQLYPPERTGRRDACHDSKQADNSLTIERKFTQRKLSTLVSLLFASAVASPVLAATNLGLVAQYGLTGGMVGDLNTTAGMINGRTICPSDNTYANGVPGCDMSSEPGYNDNGTPNPADDHYTGDLIVRTNDQFQAIASWNWNGTVGEDQVTLTAQLPTVSPGFVFDDIPASCKTGVSSISADKKTLICIRDNFDANNVGSYSEELPFPVRVEGGTPNGTVPGDITFKLEAANATTLTDGMQDGDTNNLIKVTAAPRWNINKSRYTTSYGQTDPATGEKGWVLWYKVYLELDEVSGEIDDVIAFLGNESLGDDATITFTDKLNQVSPNARLATWMSNGECVTTRRNGGDPQPYADTTNPERGIATPAGVMGINCDQLGGNGSDISVTLSHVDASLSHYPTQTYDGKALPKTRAIAAISTIKVFVPLSDVHNGANGIDDSGTGDDGSLATKNCVTDFDPEGISGESNFGALTESEADNCYNLTLYESAGSWDKVYRGTFGPDGVLDKWIYPTDAAGYRSGDGNITPGGNFASYQGYTNTGGTPSEKVILCDVIDANTYDITEIPGSTTNQAVYIEGTSGLGYKAQYATGYVGAWPPPADETPVTGDDEVVLECGDSGIIWYDTLDAALDAGGAGAAVSKVRLVHESTPEVATTAEGVGLTLQASNYVRFWIHHTARATDLGGTSLESGTLLPNYGTYQDQRSNEGSAVWRANSYIRHDANNPHEHAAGDRLILQRAKARINKSVDITNVNPGSEVTYTLEPSFTTDNAAFSEDAIVTIKDLLPKGVAYKAGSSTASYGEPTVISGDATTCAANVQDLIDQGKTCEVGNTILVWDMGTQTTNEVMPDLDFQGVVTVDATAGTLSNYTIIESSTDSSNAGIRTDNANVTVNIPASLLIVKEVLTPSHEVNTDSSLNWMQFKVNLRNGKAAALTNLDVIDVLPFNGDGTDGVPYTPQTSPITHLRNAPSSFNGSLHFDSMSFDAKGANCTNIGSLTYFFTNADAKTIDLSPKSTSNTNLSTGAVTANWCVGTEAGPSSGCSFDNAAVTGFRVRGADMIAGGTCAVNVTFATQDNRNGDIYTNNAGAAVNNLALSVMSNDVSAIVYSSTIGDKVWRDSNENGLQDEGEPAIAGIVVKLLQSDGATAVKDPANPANDYQVTTDANGNYLFDNLLAGDYVVKFELAGATATAQDAGDDALDSDVDASGITAIITLGENEDRLDIDAGIIPAPLAKGSIGNLVWNDVNANGIQDTGEAGVADVTVTLYDGTGTAIGAPVITDADGLYNFPDLDAGDYSVGFTTLPAGYQLTAQDQGGDDAKDSDVDTTTGKTATITLTQGQDDPSWDAGLFQPTSLGDYVWNDTNTDGVQEGGETGIENVAVALLDGSGNPVEDGSGNAITTTTDANGAYQFNNLAPGTYSVKFTPPSGFTLSPQDQGNDDAADSDANSAGNTANVTLAAGDTNTTLDAGMYQAASLGDFVWNDVNANGVQDGSETGVEGVVVTLLDGSGNPVEDGSGNAITTTTDVNGAYQFSNLTPGTPYAVRFTPPSGYALSPQDQGANDAADSDADSTGKTGSVTLTAGENNTTLDAGLYQSLTLGDYVWMDSDEDGVQDAGEAPVANITVKLYAADGSTLVDTVATDENGLYQFTDVTPGDYVVEFVAPANTSFTTANLGGDDALDSDVDVTGRVSVTAVSNQSDNSIDAGLIPAGVEGRVWIDNNSHNDTDDGIDVEDGVVGVRVNLMSPGADGIVGNGDDVLVANTTTGQDGLYNFGGVLPGTYYVEFEEPEGMQFVQPDIGTDDTDDSDADLGTGRTPTFDLSSGETEIDLDAGVLPGELGDRVWLDVNGNNLQDAGEPGVAGITVKLLDSAGDPTGAESITDDNGFYSFNNLLPAVYGVVFEIADDMQLVTADQGGDDSIDSDAAVDTKMATVTINSGSSNQTIDAGIVPAVIGDKVWFDSNGDGIQDADEAGIEGVTVELMGSDGSTVLDSVTTDSNGLYHFSVVPGDYSVKVVAPVGGGLTAAQQGIDAALDSDVDPLTGLTSVISVASGDVDNNWDAGIVPAEISGHIIHDVNADGVENEGDLVMTTPTTVTLTGTDIFGNVVTETVTTDANGGYHFTVVPGSYTVTETDPENYHSTGSEAGTLGSQIASDNSLNVTVNSGQHSENNDFLDNNAGGISGQVREDVDQDGDANDTDTGISGVTIQLLDDQGTVVATTQTDVNGNYNFTNVQPGDYTVQETDPSGYRSTADIEGANDNSITVSLPAGGNSTGNDYLDTVDTGVISGQVRLDRDADADVNDTDSGIAGVSIQLLDAQGTIVATTQTDAGGNYSFTNVLPGDYTVREIDLNGYHSTGDVSGANDNSIAVTLPAGGSSTGNDYLDTLDTGVISGQVRLDSDADADTRDTDNGIAGVSIELLDAQGTVVATTQTDANGNYSFTDIQPGDYNIRETDLNGYTSTGDISGVNDNIIAVTLPAGGSSTGNDYLDTVNTGTISGQVRFDSDADGDTGDTDAGIAGITIQLLNQQGQVIATTVTDSSGSYSFADIPAGDYTVRENQKSIPVSLPAGGNSTGNDYLEDEPGTGVISGQVRLDSDGDGDINDADNGISGATITLLNDQGQVVTTTVTDGGGRYSFIGLPPGNYVIRETDINGYNSTGDSNGSNDNTIAVTLPVGGTSTGNDYLDIPPAVVREPTTGVQPIPTLSEWMLIMLSGLMGIMGWQVRRKQETD